MISQHVKLSEWIFLAAGFAMLLSIPFIQMFGFWLWAAVKIVYAAGVVTLLIEAKRK